MPHKKICAVYGNELCLEECGELEVLALLTGKEEIKSIINCITRESTENLIRSRFTAHDHLVPGKAGVHISLRYLAVRDLRTLWIAFPSVITFFKKKRNENPPLLE